MMESQVSLKKKTLHLRNAQKKLENKKDNFL